MYINLVHSKFFTGRLERTAEAFRFPGTVIAGTLGGRRNLAAFFAFTGACCGVTEEGVEKVKRGISLQNYMSKQAF